MKSTGKFSSGKFSSGKKTIFLFLCLSLLVLTLSSCSSKKGGRFGKAGGFAGGANGAFSDEDLALAERNYSDGNIPLAQDGSGYGGGNGAPFSDIKFSYDSSSIPPEYRDQLQRDSEILRQDPSLKLEIEGHCDSRGTNEYNLALGKSRAKSVAKYLVNLGVEPNQLSTITYGEEIPLAQGESESSFRENRRAHFAVFRQRASLGAEDTGGDNGYRSDPFEADLPGGNAQGQAPSNSEYRNNYPY